ncbi:hypothetical protein K9L05_02680 [Candidatus Babeliales bacterium]|nr:hypothetical protein [Candidatus Babeliales bacterium]MCF7899532.1 hypothetical protein [Candidatus Babeliales bacterium]
MHFKKIIFFIFLLLISFIFGLFFFFIQKEWIIFELPFLNKRENLLKQSISNSIVKKKIKFYYFKDDKLLSEESDFVLLNDESENLKYLINNWLSFLHSEHIISKKNLAESVCACDVNQTIYISFNKSPLEKDWSILKKWNFIESLLKTIKDFVSSFKFVIFLIKHQQIKDDHLDFSQSWPIEGFKNRGEFQ